MGAFKEGEIDYFPFLQGITEPLSTPSRNLVIEEVSRVDIDKALEDSEVNDLKEGKDARVLC